MYSLSDTFNSHALRLAGSVSIGAVVCFPPLAHVLPLSRSSLTSIHALLTKHAQRTSKSSSRTLFRSRPFRFLLFSLVSLHQPLNGTHALVEVLSLSWFSDIVSPSSFSCLQSYGSFASALHRYGVCFVSNEIDSFANKLSMRQIEKSIRVKHEKFTFSRTTKRFAKKIKKIFGTRTQAL